MKKILFLLLLFPCFLFAQNDKPNMGDTINHYIFENPYQEITGSTLNNVMIQQNKSYTNRVSDTMYVFDFDPLSTFYRGAIVLHGVDSLYKANVNHTGLWKAADFYFYSIIGGGGGGGGSYWSLTGNSGTNPTTNFIGTTDSKDLVFKIYNKSSGLIDYSIGNTFLGYEAGDSTNDVGTFNTAIGYQALQNTVLSGNDNTAIGGQSMQENTTGTQNTAVGTEALQYNTIGDYNTAMGYQSLKSVTIGTFNTATGYGAGNSSTAASDVTSIGTNSLLNSTGSFNTALGDSAGNNITSQHNTTEIGYNCIGYNSNTMSFDNGDTAIYWPNAIFKKDSAGKISYPKAGQTMVFYGDNKGFGFETPNVSGSSWLVTGNAGTSPGTNYIGTSDAEALEFKVRNTEAGWIDYISPANTSFGYENLSAITSGTNNAAFGFSALPYNTSGSNNTAIGEGANGLNTTGTHNTGIGSNAVASNITGSSNTAVGYDAGILWTGDNNVALGDSSGYGWTGNNAIFIGNSHTTNATGALTRRASGLVVDTTFNSYVKDSAWLLTGNAGTTFSANKIGTTDAHGLRIVTNNIQQMAIDSINNIAITGHLGINNSFNPSTYSVVAHGYDIDINGTFTTTVGNCDGVRSRNHMTFTGSGQWATFDGSDVYTMAHNCDHFNGFQWRDSLGGAYIMGNIRGGYYAPTILSTSTVTVAAYIEMVDYGGGGTVGDSLMGLYIHPLSNAAKNWGIYESNNCYLGGIVSSPHQFNIISDIYGSTNYGYKSALAHTSGSNNAAFGEYALTSATTGSENVSFGYNSLAASTFASHCVAIGNGALYSNVGAFGLTAIGDSSMYFANSTTSTSTLHNVAVGYGTLRGSTTASNNTGNYNTAVGFDVLYPNTSGSENTAIGNGAMFANTTGGNNTACGLGSLSVNTSGSNNTACGLNALQSNTSGTRNTALGLNALAKNTTGTDVTCIGYGSNVNATGDSNATAIGANAVVNASNSMMYGSSSVVTQTFNGAIATVTTYTSSATSGTITVPRGSVDALLTGGGTTVTIVMPASAVNGQIFTIFGSASFTTPTFSDASSNTFSNAPTAIVGGVALHFKLIGTVWYNY